MVTSNRPRLESRGALTYGEYYHYGNRGTYPIDLGWLGIYQTSTLARWGHIISQVCQARQVTAFTGENHVTDGVPLCLGGSAWWWE